MPTGEHAPYSILSRMCRSLFSYEGCCYLLIDIKLKRGYYYNLPEEHGNGHDFYPQSPHFIPFGNTEQGNELMFYYGDCGHDTPRPSVWYWIHDWPDIDNNIVKIANSFEDFLDQLLPNDIFDDYDALTFEPMRDYAKRKMKERESEPFFVSSEDPAVAITPDWAKDLESHIVTTTVRYESSTAPEESRSDQTWEWGGNGAEDTDEEKDHRLLADIISTGELRESTRHLRANLFDGRVTPEDLEKWVQGSYASIGVSVSEEIIAGEAKRLLLDLLRENPKLELFTWHHQNDQGGMQILPDVIHKYSPHTVTGYRRLEN